ncbi:Copper homeostasis protein cutC-like [Acipenser ruthenus]|uniref:Copper homeostasis protein cutC homolog n=1 Tax=Acipenser ruthenus TaxID=7906 RepID=A0A662YK08_ACIRT|nr:Copper homeostasis protein cutC-like [Acipenser ruthenus]
MADGFLMEVCVDSVESAINAERGGACRIELCSSLLEGGITPSIGQVCSGLLQVVKQHVQIPVFAMICPRGGDFLYSDREVEVMKRDIHLCKSHGADRVVLGALRGLECRHRALCGAAGGTSFTLVQWDLIYLSAMQWDLIYLGAMQWDLIYLGAMQWDLIYLAFDMVRDPVVAMETLIALGFERVLTSGSDSSALEGLPLIKRLVEQAKGRIIVMPGGGITERNLQRILEGSGAQEFHCSARSSKDSAMKFRNSCVSMGAALSAPEYALKVSDVSKIRTLNAIAKNI